MRKVLATTLVGVAVLAACTPAETPSPSPEPTAPSPTVSTSPNASPSAELTPSVEPSPSPSASPTEVESFEPAPATESAEQAEVRAAWMEYHRILHKFESDPTLSDLTETQEITTGEAQNSVIEGIAQLRELGLVSRGGLQMKGIEITGPSTGSDGSDVASVSYCVDRSQLEVVSVDSGLPADVDLTFDVDETVELKRGADGVWRVALVRNAKAECDG